MTAPGLVCRELTVRFGATLAVDRVDLDVPPGQIVALLGASGSGKSSLLRGIAGLEALAAGRVWWDGLEVTSIPVHRRSFGVMFQDGQLFPHRDVAGNVAYGLAGMPRATRAARVAELLDLVGLADYANRPITALSGGQAQRVALARALAPAPRLLLLDEPLSALDRSLREHLIGVLRESLRATETTAIHVTHDQDEAFALADRVAVLADGRIRQLDTPERLWAKPIDRTVAAFLGYGPFLDAPEATRLGVPIPAGSQLALGPEALIVDPQGVPATVLDQVNRRGYLEATVRLPSGATARIRLPEPADQPSLRVRAIPASCAVLPSDAGG